MLVVVATANRPNWPLQPLSPVVIYFSLPVHTTYPQANYYSSYVMVFGNQDVKAKLFTMVRLVLIILCIPHCLKQPI